MARYLVYRIESIKRSREAYVDADSEGEAIEKAKEQGDWDNFDETDIVPDEYVAHPVEADDG